MNFLNPSFPPQTKRPGHKIDGADGHTHAENDAGQGTLGLAFAEGKTSTLRRQSRQSHANLGDRPLHLGRLLAARLLGVLARANLTFDPNVGALGEGGRVVRQPSPYDAAMPGGFGLAVAGVPVLPGTLRGQRQHSEGCVVSGGFDLGVLAKESNENTVWFRNTWAGSPDAPKPVMEEVKGTSGVRVVKASHVP